jgi:hypothetical protein
MYAPLAAQMAGDYRSAASGNWDGASTWETYNGTSWSATSSAPPSGANVYFSEGFTVTLNVPDATINDLHLGGTTGTRLAIGANTLKVSGKIRSFTGTAPGANTTSPSSTGITTSTGKLQLIGNTRAITTSGEFAGNLTNYTVEFALNANQMGTLNTAFKAGTIIFASGIIEFPSNNCNVDSGASGRGTLTIQNGATLKMGSGNIRRTGTNTSYIRNFVLQTGGTLEFTNASVGEINATTVTLDGTVYYSNTAVQSLVNKNSGATAQTITTYQTLQLKDGAKTLTANTTVNGQLILEAAAAAPSINLSTFSLNYGANAVLKYSGVATQAQTTTNTEWPATGSVPPNVDIANPNGVTLHSVRTLSGNLSFTGTGSKLLLGTNDITAADYIINGTDDGTKYIVTNGTGKVYRNAVGSTAVKFPIGPSTSLYHPLTISNAGTVDNFGAAVSSTYSTCGNAMASESIQATWDITETVAGGSNVSITAKFTGATTGINFTPTNAKLAHCNAGNAIDFAAGSVTGDEVAASGFVSFSPFFITSDLLALPVNIVKWNGTINGNTTNLFWQTASESNNQGFEVQYSSNGTDFYTIGYVATQAANGNSVQRLSYNFIHNNIVHSKNYYRLRQIGNNGVAKLSSILVLNANQPSKLAITSVALNAGSTQATVQVVAPKSQQAMIAVFDTYGKQISAERIQLGQGANAINLNTMQMASGTYFIRLIGEQGTVTRKFVK